MTDLAAYIWFTASSLTDYWAEDIDAEYAEDLDSAYRERFVAARVRDLHTGQIHNVTSFDIMGAVSRLAYTDHNYNNSGYDNSSYGNTNERFRLLLESNGEDSDIDAIDAAAVVQLATLGEVLYG